MVKLDIFLRKILNFLKNEDLNKEDLEKIHGLNKLSSNYIEIRHYIDEIIE